MTIQGRFKPFEPVLRDGRITPAWHRFLRDLVTIPRFRGHFRWANVAQALAASPIVTAPAPVPVPEAATTPAATQVAITFVVRIAQPATVSSSVELVLTWTDAGVPQTVTTTAVTGNTTGSYDTDTITITVDPGTDVDLSTTYSSTGAVEMEYHVDVVVEEQPPPPARPGGALLATG